MSDKLAKELFIKYDGIHYGMALDGEIKRYKEYGISREQEIEWIREHQQELIQKIETENIVPLVKKRATRMCFIIKTYKETAYLSSLINTLKKREPYFDSFSRLLISTIMLTTVESLTKSTGENSSILEAKQFAIDLLYKVIKNPITIDPWYTEKSGYLKDLTEQEVLKRARDLLSRWEEK